MDPPPSPLPSPCPPAPPQTALRCTALPWTMPPSSPCSSCGAWCSGWVWPAALRTEYKGSAAATPRPASPPSCVTPCCILPVQPPHSLTHTPNPSPRPPHPPLPRRPLPWSPCRCCLCCCGYCSSCWRSRCVFVVGAGCGSATAVPYCCRKLGEKWLGMGMFPRHPFAAWAHPAPCRLPPAPLAAAAVHGSRPLPAAPQRHVWLAHK